MRYYIIRGSGKRQAGKWIIRAGLGVRGTTGGNGGGGGRGRGYDFIRRGNMKVGGLPHLTYLT